jgi:catechol 2,3-dioxygenase-like lactoylglutathione lyase family enzyme
MAEFTFHHGGVSVPNLEAAIEWYGRVLGFEEERRFYIPPAKAKVAMIRKGSLRFELFEPEEGNPLPEGRSHPPSDLRTHGNKHVAFRVADLDAFIAEMTGMGIEVPFVVREDFGTGCFIRDCAGNLIEFVVEPKVEGEFK